MLENYAGYFLKEADLDPEISRYIFPSDDDTHFSWLFRYSLKFVQERSCHIGALKHLPLLRMLMTLQREQKLLGWWVVPLTLTWSLPDLGRIRQVSGHLVQVPYPWGRVQILKCAEGPQGGLRQNFPGDLTFSRGWWSGEPESTEGFNSLISALPPPPCIFSEKKKNGFL